MRPRHKAAENGGPGQPRERVPAAASMRPRHKAAENQNPVDQLALRKVRFNEAAA